MSLNTFPPLPLPFYIKMIKESYVQRLSALEMYTVRQYKIEYRVVFFKANYILVVTMFLIPCYFSHAPPLKMNVFHFFTVICLFLVMCASLLSLHPPPLKSVYRGMIFVLSVYLFIDPVLSGFVLYCTLLHLVICIGKCGFSTSSHFKVVRSRTYQPAKRR